MHVVTPFAVLALSTVLAAQSTPESYTFRGDAAWLDGVTELSDLRGKPVLIEFWGRR